MTAIISVSPNTFTDEIYIEIECSDNSANNYVIRLCDEKGKILKMVGLNTEHGLNRVSIDRLQTLRKGKYYFDVLDTEGNNIFKTILTKK